MKFNDFIVYMHESPNGLKYIGMTCQSLDIRSGKFGQNYKSNIRFYSDIQKFGWDAFKHCILKSELTCIEANDWEKYYVLLFKSYLPEFGYNQSMGGDSKMFYPETRIKLSEKMKYLHKYTDLSKTISKKLLGHNVSLDTRQKISLANKGRLLGRPSPLKGRKLSESHRLKMMGKPAWNSGLTKFTDSRVAKQSLATQGIPKSESHKRKLSLAAKKRHSNPLFNPIWVNNGVSEKIINFSELDNYKQNGYIQGRLKLDYTYITKDNVSKRVAKLELNKYLADGWILGRNEAASKNIKKSRQQYIWVYSGINFNSSEELATHLRANGYPDIVSSTITAKYKDNSWLKSKKYSSLDGKIERYSKQGESNENS